MANRDPEPESEREQYSDDYLKKRARGEPMAPAVEDPPKEDEEYAEGEHEKKEYAEGEQPFEATAPTAPTDEEKKEETPA